MVDMLMEAGPVQPGGMGAMPLSWGELQAWQQQTGRRLPPWQTRMIRELSAVFLAESQRAEKVDCPAPWVSEIDANRKLVAQKLAAAFGARAKRKG
ncbi:MAG: hypothetical protein INF91_04840 [Alphaproteobacteria bacterium]|nr:hypothetical protein [Alphaproteobacteria bacterium]